MTPDQWQFIIGLLALLDALYLAYKARKNKERVIYAAVIPRLFVGVWSMYDAFVARASMEPGRTINYIAITTLFVTANVGHFAEWRHRK